MRTALTDDQLDALPEVLDHPEDYVSIAALEAIGSLVDGCPTLADLDAWRAWMTYLRLTGHSEEQVVSAAAVERQLADVLGVA